jgi:hypothetical protein
VYQQVLHPLPSMLDLYSSQTSYLHYYPTVFPIMIWFIWSLELAFSTSLHLFVLHIWCAYQI